MLVGFISLLFMVGWVQWGMSKIILLQFTRKEYIRSYQPIIYSYYLWGNPYYPSKVKFKNVLRILKKKKKKKAPLIPTI